VFGTQVRAPDFDNSEWFFLKRRNGCCWGSLLVLFVRPADSEPLARFQGYGLRTWRFFSSHTRCGFVLLCLLRIGQTALWVLGCLRRRITSSTDGPEWMLYSWFASPSPRFTTSARWSPSRKSEVLASNRITGDAIPCLQCFYLRALARCRQ